MKRILKPGGLVILETPNHENVLVGAAGFYIDPTRRNPLPASLLRFLLEQRGFHSVRQIWLNPYDRTHLIEEDNSVLAKRFNEYFYGPRDYAMIGSKA